MLMINLDSIKAKFGITENITSADVEQMLSLSKAKSFSINESIIEEGSYDKNIYFILKGLIRVYAINHKGEEKTKSLYAENQFFFNHDFLARDRPSTSFYKTLEPTDIIYMDADKLSAIILSNSKLINGSLQYVNYLNDILTETLDSFLLNTSEERYLKFIEDRPNLYQRVPNKYIANILGVTPVQLSRIRKKIANSKSS